MNVFITGGTGFIGSHIVKRMLADGHVVTVLARNSERAKIFNTIDNVHVVAGNLNNIDSMAHHLSNKQILIHNALFWGESASQMLINDTLASVQLFEAAVKHGVSEIIYTSSTAVNDWIYMSDIARKIGAQAGIDENAKQNPVSYYGATKGASELFLQALAFQHNVKANVVRPGYTFGNPAFKNAPVQSDNRFVDIVKAALHNEPIKVIKNDGTQFIDADDLAAVYSAIIQSPVSDKTYFGLGNRFIHWHEIAQQAIKLCGAKSALVVEDKNWPDTPALFDVSAIHQDFGLSFDSLPKIIEHIKYYISLE